MNYETILITIAALGMTSNALALEYDFENNPDGISHFANVVQVPVLDEDGKAVLDDEGAAVTEDALSFSKGATARTAASLNGIIQAYGGQYDFENNQDGVSQFASVTMVGVTDEEGNQIMDEEGNQLMEPALNYSRGSKAWPATTVHRILSAYDLEFDFETYESVAGYASVYQVPKLDDDGAPVIDAEGNEETMPELSFAKGARLWNSSALHAILSAYK